MTAVAQHPSQLPGRLAGPQQGRLGIARVSGATNPANASRNPGSLSTSFLRPPPHDASDRREAEPPPTRPLPCAPSAAKVLTPAPPRPAHHDRTPTPPPPPRGAAPAHRDVATTKRTSPPTRPRHRRQPPHVSVGPLTSTTRLFRYTPLGIHHRRQPRVRLVCGRAARSRGDESGRDRRGIARQPQERSSCTSRTWLTAHGHRGRRSSPLSNCPREPGAAAHFWRPGHRRRRVQPRRSASQRAVTSSPSGSAPPSSSPP